MSREQIVEVYLHGGMSRRTFVRRMVAAGLTVTAAISYAELLAPGEARADRGTDLYENDHLLAPDVVTEAVTDLAPTTATLNATIDPNFRQTTVSFLWGTAADQLTQTLPVAGTFGGSGVDKAQTAQAVSAPLAGLTLGTTYYVQARAQNPNGTSLGNVAAFTAGVAPTPTPSPSPTPGATPTPVPAVSPNASPTLQPVPAPNPDHTPPAVGVAVLTRKRSSLIKTGMQVTLTLNEPGTATVVVRDPRRRQLSKANSGLATLPNGGSVTLTVKLSPAAKRKLRLGSKIRWTVLATGIDATGNTKQIVVPFRLG